MKIQPPPDAAAPLKLLQAGRVDLAISYEPELLLARDQGADLVAVGALVQKPLTSLMSLGEQAITDPKQLAGQARRYLRARLPVRLPGARSSTKAGVDPGSVKETNVGFKLTQAMLSKQVDATLGAFWNYEGVDLERRDKDPEILRMEDLGVPTYNELVFVARRSDLGARGRVEAAPLPPGHRTRARAAQGATPAGVDALLEADGGLDRGLQTRGRGGHAAGASSPRTTSGRSASRTRRVGGLRALDARARAAQAASRRSRAADQRVPAGRRAGPRDIGARSEPAGGGLHQVHAGQPLPLAVALEEAAHLGLVGAARSGCR